MLFSVFAQEKKEKCLVYIKNRVPGGRRARAERHMEQGTEKDLRGQSLLTRCPRSTRRRNAELFSEGEVSVTPMNVRAVSRPRGRMSPLGTGSATACPVAFTQRRQPTRKAALDAVLVTQVSELPRTAHSALTAPQLVLESAS